MLKMKDLARIRYGREPINLKDFYDMIDGLICVYELEGRKEAKDLTKISTVILANQFENYEE